MFSCGIIGLPNAGKTTLFNALTKAHAETAGYPFCTIEPNVGVLAVPDERLHRLETILRPEKTTPAAIEFVDIAGLVRNACKGEGLGNEFLGHIQQVDAITHLVRLFPHQNVAHVDGNINPVRDIRTVNAELVIKDFEKAERGRENALKKARTGNKDAEKQAAILERLMAALQEGTLLHDLDLGPDELAVTRELGLLTTKPMIYIGNVSEEQARVVASGESESMQDEQLDAFENFAMQNKLAHAYVSAELEYELCDLEDAEEAQLFLDELGLAESGLDRIVKMAYSVLGLITFFTVKGPQTRAWELPAGTTAQEAAGRIHSDMQRGFIRAEVVHCGQLVEAGSFTAAREKGHVRTEGRDYIIEDGDVVLFRFKASKNI